MRRCANFPACDFSASSVPHGIFLRRGTADGSMRLCATVRVAYAAGFRLHFLHASSGRGLRRRIHGFGVVEGDGGALLCLAAGAIHLAPREAMELRLKKVFDRLSALIVEYSPRW